MRVPGRSLLLRGRGRDYHGRKPTPGDVALLVEVSDSSLADLSLTNMNNIPKDKVGLGSTVKVFDSTKNEETLDPK